MAGLRRHLICSIGRRSSSTSYRLGNRQETSSFAPAALARLLELTGARATILATRDDQVQQRAGELAAELQGAGLDTAIVDIPDGRDETEIYGIFDALVQAAPEDEEVILDVTFGLRHLPFIYLAALTYLSALRGVPIGGIYYGPFELPDTTTNTVDFVDLRPLLDLTNWYHAIQSANDSGDLRRIAGLFNTKDALPVQTHASEAARKLAAALASGLPVESGIQAARLRKPLGKVLRDTATPAPLRLGLERLAVQAHLWAVPPEKLGKREIELTEAELHRQLTLAGWYITGQAVPSALLLLREWVVNYALWSLGVTRGWLERPARSTAERAVRVLHERANVAPLSGAQQGLANLWEKIADARNELGHVGMRPIEITPDIVRAREYLKQCQALLDAGPMRFDTGGKGGTLLVSALGNSPGLLFSAVSLLEPRPDELIVLVSKESRAKLGEALERSGRSDLLETAVVLEMADALEGYNEHKTLISSTVKVQLAAASNVVINLTGGTTVMQYVLSKVAAEAVRLGAAPVRIALVDRRPTEEQRANQYVLGKLITIEETSSAEEASDAAT